MEGGTWQRQERTGTESPAAPGRPQVEPPEFAGVAIRGTAAVRGHAPRRDQYNALR